MFKNIDGRKVTAGVALCITFAIGGFKEIGKKDVANILMTVSPIATAFVAGWFIKRPGDPVPEKK